MGVERTRALTDLLGLLGQVPGAPAPPATVNPNDLLGALLENVPDFVVISDPQGTILFMNRQAPGTPPAIGRSVYEFVAPEDRVTVQAAFASVMHTRQPAEYETGAIGPHGTTHRYHVRIAPILRDSQVVALTMIATDITGRLETERALRERDQQLRQAQKMEAIGQLVAGLAHNFNNLLMAILPNLDRAERLAIDQARPFLVHARQAATRAGQLVSDLLLYAGKSQPRPRSAEDLSGLVRQTVDMFRASVGATVAIDVEVPSDLPAVEMDPMLIEQALLNLLLNARDAFAGLNDRAPHVRVAARQRDGVVEIAVTDNGCGMDEMVRAHIFEPFYTTKKAGLGTGLGLSTTRAIIAEHGGRLTFESQPGHGTTFFVLLPPSTRALGSGEIRVAVPAPADEHPRAATVPATILLVDDEPLVRRAVGEVLRDAGYRVIEAADGAAGLQKFTENRSEIELVLVDEAMPIMTGSELMVELRKVAPTTKAVLITGYAADARATQLVNAVIEKPIEAEALLRRIAGVLAGVP